MLRLFEILKILKKDKNKFFIFCFLVFLFILPFVFSLSFSELFEVPKMFFVYDFVFFISFIFFIRQKSIKISKTHIYFLIFLFFIFLSSIFSINPHLSFFGVPTRLNGGFFSFFSFFIFSIVFFQVYKKQYEDLFILVFITNTTILAVWGILEHFGHSLSCLMITGHFDVNCWVQDVQSRVFATFGQPNWYAAYLVAVLPLIYKMFKKTKSFLYLLSIFLTVSGILFSISKSSLIAFILVLVFTVIKEFKTDKKFVLYIFISSTLPFIIFSNFLKTKTLYFIKQTIKIQNSKASVSDQKTKDLSFLKSSDSSNLTKKRTIDTNASISSDKKNNNNKETEKNSLVSFNKTPIASSTWDIRKTVWTGALKLFIKKPIFGFGLSTFEQAYFITRPASHNYLSEWNFTYNKAHNEFLDFLSCTGLFGTSSYLLLIFYPFTKKNNFFKKLSLLSIYTTNFFGFSTVTINILMFVLFIFIDTSVFFSFKIQNYFLLPVLLVFYYMVFCQKIADKNFKKAQDYLSIDLNKAQELLEKAYKCNKDPRFPLYQIVVNIQEIIQINNSLDKEKSEILKNELINLVNKTILLETTFIDQNKDNPISTRIITKLNLKIGQIDKRFLQINLISLLYIVENNLAPTDPNIYFLLGKTYESLNDLKNADLYYRKALELKSDYPILNILYSQK